MPSFISIFFKNKILYPRSSASRFLCLKVLLKFYDKSDTEHSPWQACKLQIEIRNLFKLFSTTSSRQRSSVCLPLPPMLSEFPKVNSPAGTFSNFINSWLRWNERGKFWDVWALGLCGVGQPCAPWRGVAWWGVACRSVKRCGVAWRKIICCKGKWCSVASNNEAWRQVACRGVKWCAVASSGVAWRQ